MENAGGGEPFFTIGHSTLPLDEFIRTLRGVDIGLVVDVRTVPRSRRNPQFNRDALPDSLSAFGIGYEHLASLGGLRGRSPDVAPEVNAFWKNESFHNYADYAQGEAFRGGLERLRELGLERRAAIMCAETLWWRCHRRLIADYLLAAGATVFHLIGPAAEPARLTDGARPDGSGRLTYPAITAVPGQPRRVTRRPAAT
jgi:uncharacterized protein (DUF488 family)